MKPYYYLATIAIAGLMASCEKEIFINDEGDLVPKTVVDDPSLPSIEVNGTRLHSEAFGSPADPMVVFLHGGPGSDYRSALNITRLTDDGYYVILFDQRGAGLSERHPHGSYTLQQAYDDLSAVIKHYRSSETQKVFLFGHSWGAILAAGYIGHFPGDITGAILAEPGGFKWDDVASYGERIHKISLFDEESNDVVYADQFITGRENNQAVLDYQLALRTTFNYAHDNLEGVPGPLPFWRYGAVAYNSILQVGEHEKFDVSGELTAFESKVLFLYSELNRAYGETYCRQQADYFRDADIAEIKGTGHELIYYGWNNTYPIVKSYLNSLK